MDETGIAWFSDSARFVQPTGFKYQQVAGPSVTCAQSNLPSNCKQYQDKNGVYYNFYYPNDDSIQYLYESYPNQISPIDGVTDEHFKVWMRSAALPTFRKLYGKIKGPFKNGDVLTFAVSANYEVTSFSGKKRLVISTVGDLGGKNPDLGVAYIVVGSLCFIFGFIFAVKQAVMPRQFGDASLLQLNGS